MNIPSPLEVTYIPIGTRVLLSCPEIEDAKGHVRQDALLVPAGMVAPKSKFVEMRVLAAGPECRFVEEGNIVLFNPQNAGGERRGDGFEYRWTEEAHIIAVVKRKLNALPATD